MIMLSQHLNALHIACFDKLSSIYWYGTGKNWYLANLSCLGIKLADVHKCSVIQNLVDNSTCSCTFQVLCFSCSAPFVLCVTSILIGT
jgi:hypothetical protein